ncbi:MAG: hypothetical protein KGL34_08240, partial [Gammaproteobacteria bacterium]|nr:hypothetical protein [Gammaproteobacteria bacterium]
EHPSHGIAAASPTPCELTPFSAASITSTTCLPLDRIFAEHTGGIARIWSFAVFSAKLPLPLLRSPAIIAPE